MISESLCANEVFMQLDGQAHDGQYKKAGKYTKANGLSSGLPYWVEFGGSYALWFKNGKWMVGDKSDLGDTTGYLHSTNSLVCPESVAMDWKYWDGEEFLDAQGNAKMYKYEGMIHQGNEQFIIGK